MTRIDHVVPKVYTRASWADSWVLQDHLYCDSLIRTVAPSIGRALLRYEHGRIRRTFTGTHTAGSSGTLTDTTKNWETDSLVGAVLVNSTDDSSGIVTSNTATTVSVSLSGGDENDFDLDDEYRITTKFQDFDPLDIMRHFVRVTYTPNRGPGDPSEVDWYGVVTDDVRRMEGSEKLSSGIDQGTQQLQALSLEWLFQRKQVAISNVDDGAGGKKTINRAIPFNAESLTPGAAPNNEKFKNRSPVVGPEGVYLFVDDPKDAEPWTAKDAIDYLAEYFPPTSQMTWLLTPASGDFVNWLLPQKLHVHGRTLYDILNQIIDRRRGLVWFISVDDDIGRIELNVESLAESEVILPSADTLPANSNQQDMLFVDDRTVRDAVRKIESGKKYEQVRVTGSPLGSCFSLSVDDGTLEKAWTATQEQEYKDGASGFAGYAAANQETKIRMNDLLRKGETLRHVYTSFRVPEDWDGLVGDGEGNDITEIALPDQSGLALEPFWYSGLRFQNRLPLRRQFDYSIQAAYPTDNSIGHSQADFLYPMCIFKDPVFGWYPGTDLGATAEAETLGNNGFSASCRIRMHDHQPGVDIIPSGAMPHVLSGGDFLPSNLSAGADQPSNTLGAEHDWEKMIVTVYCQYDNFVEAVWPSAADDARNDQQAVLEINLGDRARLDYLAVNTVIGVSAGGDLIRAQQGGYVRDDRDFIQDVARVLYEWHKKDRSAVVVSFQQVDETYSPGSMINEIGTSMDREPINSIVTSVAHDFLQNTTTVQTEFAELDVGILL